MKLITKKNINYFKKDILAWIFMVPAGLALFLFVMKPLFTGIVWSFFDMTGYTVEKFVGLENYKTVLSDTLFLKTLWNTCQYVLWSILIGYALPIIMALVLNETVHMRGLFRTMVYFPSILPAVAVSLLWYFLYYPDTGGLLNIIRSWLRLPPSVWLQNGKYTIMLIVISMTWSGCGYTTIFYLASLQSVNRELYEAAIIDGAGFLRRIRTIALPHISGIMLLMFVKQIIGVFSILDQPMQMTDGGPNGASNTLGLVAYKYGFVNVKPEMSITIGVIMFMILMVFTCFYFVLDKKIERD